MLLQLFELVVLDSRFVVWFFASSHDEGRKRRLLYLNCVVAVRVLPPFLAVPQLGLVSVIVAQLLFYESK